MNTWADNVPVGEITARARQVRPGRVLLLVIAAAGTATGWAIGRFFLSLGWLAGRSWLIAAFFAEAVIYGFRQGASLPQPDRTAGKPPDDKPADTRNQVNRE